MKTYRLTRLNGESTTIQAESFEVHPQGGVMFFAKHTLVAYFSNVELVQQMPSE